MSHYHVTVCGTDINLHAEILPPSSTCPAMGDAQKTSVRRSRLNGQPDADRVWYMKEVVRMMDEETIAEAA